MSWPGWLFLAAVFALVVAVLRGIVQLVSSFLEDFSRGRKMDGHRAERWRISEPESTRDLEKLEAKQEHTEEEKQAVRLAVHSVGQASRASWLSRLAERLQTVTVKKGYDYWVARALSEGDPDRKLEYLSVALRLNPDYLPAWGMKSNTLLELGRYEEALQCLEKPLKTHPRALTWHKKGQCCYHLHRLEEALDCFRKAREACPGDDRQLSDDIARMTNLVESDLRAAGAS